MSAVDPNDHDPRLAADEGTVAPESVVSGDGTDWRTPLLAGRFRAARQAALEASAESGATVDIDARLELIAACERVAARLLAKEYATALRPLERLDEAATEAARAAGIALAPIRADAEALCDAGRALDERDPELAREKLQGVGGAVFGAEEAALIGTVAVYDGDTAAAEAAFLRALELDAEHVRALTNLGNLALEAGRIDEAIARYQAAIAIDDEFANAHHNLGVALRKQGRIGPSVKALRTAQRASQRRLRQEARQELSRRAGGRWVRRLLYVVAAIVAIAIYLRLT